MKRIILAVLFILSSAMNINSSACSSFNRRWGANSYITNIPLFFKPYQYEERGCGCACSTSNPKYSMKKKEVRQTKPVAIKQNGRTTAPTTVVTQKSNNNATTAVKNIAVARNSKPAYLKDTQHNVSTAVANSQMDSMRKRQEKLEVKRMKIQQELAELQQKQSDFKTASV